VPCSTTAHLNPGLIHCAGGQPAAGGLQALARSSPAVADAETSTALVSPAFPSMQTTASIVPPFNVRGKHSSSRRRRPHHASLVSGPAAPRPTLMSVAFTPVETWDEVYLFMELFPHYAKKSSVDWQSMADAYNRAVIRHRQAAPSVPLRMKYAGQLRSFHTSFLKQERIRSSILQMVALQGLHGTSASCDGSSGTVAAPGEQRAVGATAIAGDCHHAPAASTYMLTAPGQHQRGAPVDVLSAATVVGAGCAPQASTAGTSTGAEGAAATGWAAGQHATPHLPGLLRDPGQLGIRGFLPALRAVQHMEPGISSAGQHAATDLVGGGLLMTEPAMVPDRQASDLGSGQQSQQQQPFGGDVGNAVGAVSAGTGGAGPASVGEPDVEQPKYKRQRTHGAGQGGKEVKKSCRPCSDHLNRFVQDTYDHRNKDCPWCRKCYSAKPSRFVRKSECTIPAGHEVAQKAKGKK